MLEILEKVRQKSPRQKKQIAFSFAFFISGLIFVIWLSVIYPDFRQKQIQTQNASSLEPSPLSTFGETLTGGFKAIKDTLSSIKNSSVYYSTTTSRAKTSNQ
ncbi:hypothetical protein H0W91_00495 [Patescibacteria group bacterium]|nr:hypothetical protein [Patescibacteria group bacterium]